MTKKEMIKEDKRREAKSREWNKIRRERAM